VVLGVDRGATAREISRAYRRQMRRHHPDSAGQPVGCDADRGALAEVQAAYAVLRDGAARARYDAQHPPAQHPSAQPPPAQPPPVRSAPGWPDPDTEPPVRAGPVRWRPAR
jgi:DnaJ-class molecular chaperone